MAREEEVQYEQDNLGNERKKIDALRAQEGMDAEPDGIVDIDATENAAAPAEASSAVLAYEKPTHADEVYLSLIHAYNSVSSGNDTFTIYEVELDSGGNITSRTQRSVPIHVQTQRTRSIGYEGIAFENSIAVSSEFQGQIGLGVKSDHKEYSEPESEQTEAP